MNEFIVTVNNKKKLVKILEENKVDIDGKVIQTSLQKISNNLISFLFGNKVYEIAINKNENEKTRFLIDGWYIDSVARTKIEETAFELQRNIEKQKHHSEIKAPMPGLILKIKKKVGEKVEIGEPVLILEAMKMENEIHSPATGIVKTINFKEGDSVEKNSIIMVIE
ncbi:MAG: acetyl-CoA carboxylase biotin carboxyl carrier protein subunit [Melioribacteraceae bacterium]|nr:acetyl-CoA carboxylase biotin carboxyl carrier protein subunit [Melioribacteraceae bacterium]